MSDTFAYRDKYTGEPCPTRGNILCTLAATDRNHRHVGETTHAKLEVVSVPFEQPPPAKAPSWWRTFGKKTGTIVRYRGRLWQVVEVWLMGGYEGRVWKLVEEDLQ